MEAMRVQWAQEKNAWSAEKAHIEGQVSAATAAIKGLEHEVSLANDRAVAAAQEYTT